ncbi:MAG: CapA family protein [Thermodesulfobacteriota bacterium]
MKIPVRYGWFFLVALSVFTSVLIAAGSVPAQETSGTAGTTEVIRVAAMGDIMLGTIGHLPEDGGAGSFTQVKPYLKDADVVFGNQEGALSDLGACIKKGEDPYCFRTPTSYVKWYKEAGFNMLSLANNHAHDFGPEALQQTMTTLEENGIQFSGPPGTVARLEARGVKVAMAAFYTGRGGHPFHDLPRAKSIVAGLAKENDLVIVSFHAGAEGAGATHVRPGSESFMGENRGDVIKFSHAVVDSGADLVLGHGPHVPRAMEVYKGRLIAYSLGNFCTGKRISVTGVSGYAPLLLVELEPGGRLAGGRIVGFTQAYGGHPQYDSENKAAKLIYHLGQEDLPQSNAVAPDGTLIPPRD